MLTLLRKITPKVILKSYHYFLARAASLFYGNPSNNMIVIGVTGTNGKTTTAYCLAKLLEASGEKTGLVSTAICKIGDEEWFNDLKMTMPGRFILQKMLWRMKKEGCLYAVVETSSQGLDQFRHIGVNYDYGVFTNLTPEHIEAHGGFDNYKKAKKILFDHIANSKIKNIKGREVKKTMTVNLDDEHSSYYLLSNVERKIGFTLKNRHDARVQKIYTVKDVSSSLAGLSFDFESTHFSSPMIGLFNAYNLSAALSVVFEEGLDVTRVKHKAEGVSGVPGRLEILREGQPFTVIVDYAPEPYALKASYESLKKFNRNKFIHVLGSAGGGRDIARRPILGKMAGEMADIVVVTNEDPYDDDPREIIDSVAHGALDSGKVLGQNLFTFDDRVEAIHFALDKASDGDLVYITGKGCEQYIMTKNGGKIPHDDRVVVRNYLNNQYHVNE